MLCIFRGVSVCSSRCYLRGFVAMLAIAAAAPNVRAANLGPFEGHADIGKTGHAGSVEFNADRGVFTVSGGGDDMWGTADAFHFVYKEASGDVSLTADIRWIGEGGHKNRKACFLVRQSLEPGAAYVDAASHGDGHMALQWRTVADGKTGDVGSKVISSPKTVRIEKRGDEFQMWAAAEGGELQPIGKPYRLHLDEPFYVGLSVCSHDNNKLETVEFSNVVIGNPKGETIAPK
jgi:TolB protein